MALSELYVMERSELEDRLAESRKELFNLRFQKATGQLDNTARVGRLRKDVARILTVLRQQELGLDQPARIPAPSPRPAPDRTDRSVADEDAGTRDGEDAVSEVEVLEDAEER